MVNVTQRTFTPKGGEIHHAWRVVDADGKSLGRLASEVAGYLRGKHLPTFSEHMDVGDHVIVINASRVRVTGNKLRDKFYYRHSTYPGGLKAVALGDVLAKHPDQVIKHAVRGMLPHNALGRKMLRKLRVYAGDTHPHQAQLVDSARRAARAAAGATDQPAAPAPAPAAEAALPAPEAPVAALPAADETTSTSTATATATTTTAAEPTAQTQESAE